MITTRTEQSLTVCPNGCINVRDEKVIEEDGIELTRTFHRKVVDVVDDIANESQRLQDLAAVVWTPEVKEARQAVLAKLIKHEGLDEPKK